MTNDIHLGQVENVRTEILVCRVKKYVHAKFCPNLTNENRDPNAEPKCDYWGQIWSILDL